MRVDDRVAERCVPGCGPAAMHRARILTPRPEPALSSVDADRGPRTAGGAERRPRPGPGAGCEGAPDPGRPDRRGSRCGECRSSRRGGVERRPAADLPEVPAGAPRAIAQRARTRPLAGLVGPLRRPPGPRVCARATDGELRELVRAPAESVGLTVETELLDAVVADVLGRVGALPLLSTALVGTWERRSGNRLTLAGYLQAGGVAGALTRSTEAAYAALDDSGREGRASPARPPRRRRRRGARSSGALCRSPSCTWTGVAGGGRWWRASSAGVCSSWTATSSRSRTRRCSPGGPSSPAGSRTTPPAGRSVGTWDRYLPGRPYAATCTDRS
jgi:hypothetical protein